jgi:hypothetical protein
MQCAYHGNDDLFNIKMRMAHNWEAHLPNLLQKDKGA